MALAGEVLARGATAIAVLLDEAFELALIDFCEVEDCFPERAGAISKKRLSSVPMGRAVPSDLDVVVVRGVVKARDSSIIACAYGTGDGTVSWRLDDDASATFDSASELKAPLCRGIELAIEADKCGRDRRRYDTRARSGQATGPRRRPARRQHCVLTISKRSTMAAIEVLYRQ